MKNGETKRQPAFLRNVSLKRVLMSLFGVVFTGVAGGIFKTSALGVGPYQAMLFGLNYVIPLSFGTLSVVMNLALLFFALFTDRSKLGIGTIFTFFLLGYSTEFTIWLLGLVLPEPGIVVRILCLILGVLCLSFSTAAYMTADLGISPYDAIAVVMAEKWKLGKFKFMRITTDCVCVVIGVAVCLLSGGGAKGVFSFLGIGTIIIAFFMGPLIQFWKDRVMIPFVNAGKK